MKRMIYDDLINWKNNVEDNKPLIVLGARQVGKTYIIDEFCRNEFKNYIKVNLLEDNKIVDLYKEDDSSQNEFMKLKVILDFDIE